MKFLIALFIILTNSISIARGQNCDESLQSEILKSVKLSGFNCTKLTIDNCSFNECTGTLGSYPAPVLITIPARTNSFRVHFHGHHLGLPETKPYEESLSQMIKAFGIDKSLCASSEVAVFPRSIGKNSTYQEYFKNTESYTQFFKSVKSTLGNSLEDSQLHLSGHSGGGKYVAGALDAEIKTSKVSIYDGIYSSETKNSLKKWYKEGNGKLTIGTIKGMKPDKFSAELRDDLPIKITSKKSSINGTIYDVHLAKNFVNYSRYAGEAGSTKAHFDVLSQIWPLEKME